MSKVRLYDVVDINKSTFKLNNIYQYIYYLDTANITKNTISAIQKLYIKKDIIPSRAKRAVSNNTIVYSSVRPNLCHFGILSEVPSNMVVSTGFITLDVKNNKIDPYYLFYLITTKDKVNYITNIANTSVSSYPSITPEILGNMEIEIVDNICIQKQIGNLLSNIDKKIELNNKINDELEAMAKTIYDYWFLQFEFPNEEGKPYKSSGGKMVWNEELKREIPEGWEVKKLKKYISVFRGVNYKKDDILSNKEINYIPLIKSNNIQNGKILFDDIIFVSSNVVNKNQFLDKNSILMTMSSGSKEHMGKTTIIYDSLDYTFGAFCSKIEITEDMRCFLSIFFRNDLFKTLINNITSGTNINNINNEQLYNIKMTIPNKKVLQKFENIFNPILDKQGIIQKENQELTSLRDFLLPLLMNGQVGFKEDKA